MTTAVVASVVAAVMAASMVSASVMPTMVMFILVMIIVVVSTTAMVMIIPEHYILSARTWTTSVIATLHHGRRHHWDGLWLGVVTWWLGKHARNGRLLLLSTVVKHYRLVLLLLLAHLRLRVLWRHLWLLLRWPFAIVVIYLRVNLV